MNHGRLTYRDMTGGEEPVVCELVRRVFDQFVAPQFSRQGADEFLAYARPEGLAQRLLAGHIATLALDGGAPVGMIEIRDRARISLLFVDGAQQGRGVGRELVSRALRRCAEGAEGPVTVSVHASPNSVGFCVEGPERIERGIRYVPMWMQLTL